MIRIKILQIYLISKVCIQNQRRVQTMIGLQNLKLLFDASDQM